MKRNRHIIWIDKVERKKEGKKEGGKEERREREMEESSDETKCCKHDLHLRKTSR